MVEELPTNAADESQKLEINRLFVQARVLSLDGYKGIADEAARVLAPQIGDEFKGAYSDLIASGLID